MPSKLSRPPPPPVSTGDTSESATDDDTTPIDQGVTCLKPATKRTTTFSPETQYASWTRFGLLQKLEFGAKRRRLAEHPPWSRESGPARLDDTDNSSAASPPWRGGCDTSCDRAQGIPPPPAPSRMRAAFPAVPAAPTPMNFVTAGDVPQAGVQAGVPPPPPASVTRAKLALPTPPGCFRTPNGDFKRVPAAPKKSGDPHETLPSYCCPTKVEWSSCCRVCCSPLATWMYVSATMSQDDTCALERTWLGTDILAHEQSCFVVLACCRTNIAGLPTSAFLDLCMFPNFRLWVDAMCDVVCLTFRLRTWDFSDMHASLTEVHTTITLVSDPHCMHISTCMTCDFALVVTWTHVIDLFALGATPVTCLLSCLRLDHGATSVSCLCLNHGATSATCLHPCQSRCTPPHMGRILACTFECELLAGAKSSRSGGWKITVPAGMTLSDVPSDGRCLYSCLGVLHKTNWQSEFDVILAELRSPSVQLTEAWHDPNPPSNEAARLEEANVPGNLSERAWPGAQALLAWSIARKLNITVYSTSGTCLEFEYGVSQTQRLYLGYNGHHFRPFVLITSVDLSFANPEVKTSKPANDGIHHRNLGKNLRRAEVLANLQDWSRQQEDGTTDTDVQHEHTGPDIRLWFANINSLAEHLDGVLDMEEQADVIGLSEHCLAANDVGPTTAKLNPVVRPSLYFKLRAYI
eukprot:5285128-Amphidinium_carterae.1